MTASTSTSATSSATHIRAIRKSNIWIEAKDLTAIDWDDREQREELREHVGLDEFHRLYDEMLARKIVATVNGHAIRTIRIDDDQLFAVGSTCVAFKTRDEAEIFATIQIRGRD